MVMGRESCFEGRGFESQHRIQDGHISHIFAIKFGSFEKTKINEKEAGDGTFFNINIDYSATLQFVCSLSSINE